MIRRRADTAATGRRTAGQGPGDTGQDGLTLIELMIAMLILGIVVAAAFNVAYSLMASYRDHQRAMAVERSARGAMTVLASAVRNASPGVPNGQIADLVDCSTTWKGISVEDHSDAPDVLRVVHATGGVVTSLRQKFTQDSNAIVVEDGSELKVGDQVMVTDLDSTNPRGTLVQIVGIKQSGDDWILSIGHAGGSATKAKTLCSDPSLRGDFTYDVRSIVIRAQVVTYSVDTSGAVPVLMMAPNSEGNPEAVAEGIEDLQVAIGVNRIGSDSLEEYGAAPDDDDWVYNNAGDTDLPAISSNPYRAVRLTVTARSVGEVSTVPTSIRPPAEDRDGASTADQYKRRSLSTTIEIRNLNPTSSP